MKKWLESRSADFWIVLHACIALLWAQVTMFYVVRFVFSGDWIYCLGIGVGSVSLLLRLRDLRHARWIFSRGNLEFATYCYNKGADLLAQHIDDCPSCQKAATNGSLTAKHALN